MAIKRVTDEYYRVKDKEQKKIPVLRANSAPSPAVSNSSIKKREKNIIEGVATPEVDRDRSIIHAYEELPNYDSIQRDKDFWAASENDNAGVNYQNMLKKQSMVDEYNAAKNRQITNALNNYGGNSETIPTLAGVNYNKLLHPFKYADAKKEIEPYLAENGITMEQLENYFKRQTYEDQNKKATEYAKEHPVLGTAESFITNQIGNVNSGANAVASYLHGKPIEENQASSEYGKLTGAIRGTVKDEIKNNANTKVGGALASGAYDVLTGLGDMGMSMALTGFNQPGSLALMSYGAGTQTLNDQSNKKTTDDQKIASALASSGIEAITEMIPLDNLFKMANNPAGRQTFKQIIGNVLKQAGQEATEEAVSEVANTFADNLINGQNSDYAQDIQNYVAQGMTQEQATRQAILDVAKNSAYSALIGGISGGIMGGGANIVNNTRYFGPTIDANYQEYIDSQKGSGKIPDVADYSTRGNFNYPDENIDFSEKINPWAIQEEVKKKGRKKNTQIDPTKKIPGFDAMDKELNKWVNMYGTPEAQALLPELKANINEYLQTGNQEAIDKAVVLGAQLDEMMAGREYRRKRGDHTVTQYEGNQMVDTILNENKALADVARRAKEPPVDISPREANIVMREDIGLNPNTKYEERIVQNPDGTEELIIDPYADEPKSTQTSRNSMYRYFDDMPDVQDIIKENRKAGNFDKDVHTNEDTLKIASRELVENKEAVMQNLINKEYVDEVDTAESLMLARELFRNNDSENGLRYLENLSDKASTPGRVLQLLGAMAGTGEGTIIKAKSLIKEEKDTYFKSHKNRKKKESCGKLATALKNIGNDHTNDPVQKEKTFLQIRQGVTNELAKESSSIFGQFTDDDIEYLARLVERGYTANEIQNKLETKIVTGNWDISAEDVKFVLDKFNEASKFDRNGKQAVELEVEAFKRLAKYLPEASFMEKWNALRYLAMLGNTRTHSRNIIGNTMFGKVVTSVADELGGLIEAAANNTAKAFGGQGFERTKTAMPKSPEMLEASKKYGIKHAWAQLTDARNKYTDTKRNIEAEKSIFKTKWLEKFRTVNNDLLTKEDIMSIMDKYKRAMAGYLQANGKDARVFTSMDPADITMVQNASNYAVRRAKEATFHEDNKVADWLSNASRSAKNMGGVGGNLAYGLIESLIPFKKTPANILKQSLEYSPLNVLNMAYDAMEKNPAMFIENLSKTMTGSAIMALGAIMASKGWLRAKGKKENEDLDKLTGEQDFSLKIGNKSYTIDWAAPAALPLFVGVRLAENNDNVIDALASISDPIVEMSMLQGFKNSLENASSVFNGSDSLGNAAINTMYGYVSQGVPTALGQVARAIDDTRRSTYTGQEGTIDTLMKNVKKTQNKIPVLSNLNQPYVDAWGQTQENAGGNFLGRLAYNMLSPGYISDTSKTPTEQELYRLKEQMANGTIETKNIIPTIANKSYNKEKLTPEEYTQIAQSKGQNIQKLYDVAISDPRYANLPDESKAELLDTLSKFGNALSKAEIFDYDIAGSNTYKKRYEAYEYGGVDGLISYILASNAITEAKNSAGRNSVSKADRINGLESADISEQDKIQFLKMMDDYTKTGQYIEKFLGDKYAYDWYMIEANSGSKKEDKIYTVLTSDLPDEEKNAFISVLGMNEKEIKYHLATGE